MQEPKPDVDALGKNLQASLAKRRPKTWKPVLAAVVIASMFLVAVWWWLRAPRRGEPLHVVAMDSLVSQGETPMARALLFPSPDDATSPRLRGRRLDFFEQLVAEPRKFVATSDANGHAEIEWPTGETEVSEFYVKHLDEDRRQGSLPMRGLIWVWPKKAPLLIVDADETLIDDDVNEEAIDALVQSNAAGWRIVYLTLASATAADYRRARSWIEGEPKLTRGPILGRAKFSAEESSESARRDLLNSLKARFEGPMIAIVKNAESIATCKEAGIRAIPIGDATDGRTVKWADVPANLK